MVEESIRIANLEYKSHYFFHQNFQQVKLDINSFDDYFNNYKTKQLNMIQNKTSLSEHIKINALKCRHLLHDDSWVKVTTKHNILNKIEDLEEINELIKMENDSVTFVNSINSDDISNIEFLCFVDKLNDKKFNGYSIEFKYIDFDEDTDNIKWIVIYCKKDDNKNI